MRKDELRRIKVSLHLRSEAPKHFKHDINICFTSVTEYLNLGKEISFKAAGDKLSREWLDESVFMLTRGLGIIQSLTVECLDDSEQNSKENGGRAALDGADTPSNSG